MVIRVTPGGVRRRADGAFAVAASIDLGAAPRSIECRTSEGPVAAGGDPFLAAVLLPAMKMGATLRVAGGVSPRLLSATKRIQEIYHAWYPELRPIVVEAEPAEMGASEGGVGCLFSGGVDSFYTALKHLAEITSLIFVHGFDMALRDTGLREKVSASLRQAAAELGKQLIEVETNVRHFSDPYVDWGERYHGSGLASVGLLLGAKLRTVYIPATFPYTYLEPLGSHPLVDPLWSTERTEFVHDGNEATRTEKVAAIARSETAMRWLRVCWEHPSGEYNCGRCEKCLRTMVNLELAGALSRCRTFDSALDLDAVARVPANDRVARLFIEENLKLCLEVGGRRALARALRDSLGRRYYKGIGRLLRGDLRRRVLRRARWALRPSIPAPADLSAFDFDHA